jgi:hypothetical protein
MTHFSASVSRNPSTPLTRPARDHIRAPGHQIIIVLYYNQNGNDYHILDKAMKNDFVRNKGTARN